MLFRRRACFAVPYSVTDNMCGTEYAQDHECVDHQADGHHKPELVSVLPETTNAIQPANRGCNQHDVRKGHYYPISKLVATSVVSTS